ncbi:DUF1631 family protein [Aestuariirhabdus sp. Z084]|uniref:DUF1631 family protein n=1 Tax=Aestuariirhabdus haliotis TaxID=2918751 RepID=UPI00201B3575|nr:DUF1631 family protein [Aestuariirhabdus haliotis]MCL6416691.1 DUF1631 family protein [Aestuariirhabdus haliotis]MCL6420720.1 DUF1631 family protein [Aestuariirhabdus haliotis]
MSDERRTSVRVAFNCRAQLMLMGHAALNCRVADFCPGGFYLTQIAGLDALVADPFNPVVNGSTADLLIFPEEQDNQPPLRFRTQVTRIEADSLGVELPPQSAAGITSLQQIAGVKGQQQPPDPASRPVQPSLAIRTKLVQRLRPQLNLSLDMLLESFFELASERLLADASKAANNTEQALYFDLMGELKSRRELLSQKFQRQILDAWDAFSNAEVEVSDVKPEHSENDLSVVDKEEFEDWLTINVMVTNAESQYRQHIEWLQARFNVLAGQDLDTSHTPLSPYYIYGCLQASTAILGTTPSLLQQLYRIFETAALPWFGELYVLFNTELKNAGILPDLETRKKQVRRMPTASKSESTRVSNPEANKPQVVDDQGPVEPNGNQGLSSFGASASLSAVQNLLAWRRSVNEAGDRSAANHEEFVAVTPAGNGNQSVQAQALWSQGEMMEALSALQVQLQQQPNASTDLRTQLAETLNPVDTNAPKRDFSGIQQDCLDIVDSLFEVLMDHHEIPETVQPWLKAQQVPLLKVLVQDQTFFSNAQHPARQVLNKMARLAAAPSGSVDSMQRTLKSYCDRILTEYDHDPAVYESVQQDLEKLENRQLKAIDRNTQRLVRTCDGQQKLQQAKQVVANEIGIRIGGKKVPPIVLELLDTGLRDAMVLTSVREGSSSESWHDIWQLFDQLLEWLGVRQYRGDSIELERTLETDALLDMVERYLEIPAVEPYRRDYLIDRLRQTLQQDPAEIGAADWVEAPAIKAGSLAGLGSPDRNLKEENARWRQRAKRLQVGDWLGQIASEDRGQDVKLAWIGDGFSAFVFVNRQGLKAVEYDLDELAQAMSNGLLPVEHRNDDSLLDHGMFNIVQNVYKDMAYQTSHDQLTGLLSRKAFEKQLHNHISSLGEDENRLTLLFIDVDLFKAVNKNCGTEAGDQLLQEMAAILKKEVASSLITGRVGGNEFALVLDAIELNVAMDVAETLRSAVESMGFTWGKKKLLQTVSIGVSALDASVNTAADLMNQASTACVQAKEGGRNRVVAYSSQSSEQQDEMGMLALVQRVLDEELLELRCQRIQNLASPNAPGHYEVLLSVRDEEGVDIPLEAFICAAEKHNRMAAVDRWVIRTMFNWIEQNPLQADLMGSYAINLSGNSLNDNRLMEFILEQFSKTGVAPDRVCFEVTETATIANIAKTADLIREMKKFGCRFSLDDFGTGLSSFAYLKQLPVDYLKIDGVFIREIAESSVDYAMVKSIKEVGHFMGMKVIAEYAESDNILRCLRDIGVDYAQGYGVERPKPLAYYRDYYADPALIS